MGVYTEFQGKIIIRNLDMDNETDMVVIEVKDVDAVIAALRALAGEKPNE
jgi:hypothetical protein